MIRSLLLTCLLACGDKDDGVGITGPDGGEADGGGTDGGGADGGATDGGVFDGGVFDGGVFDGGVSDGGVSDGGATWDCGTGGRHWGDGGTAVPVITYDLEGDWKGSTLNMTWIDPEALFGASAKKEEAPEVGGVLACEAVSDDSVRLNIGEVPDADMFDFDEEAGLRAAVYVPTLHIDGDGDLEQGGDEPITAVSEYAAMWLKGSVSSPWTELGLKAGWNSVRFDGRGVAKAELEVGDSGALPLAVELVAVEAVTIGGSSSGSGTDDLRLGLMPSVVSSGGAVEDWLYDAALADHWEITLSSAPPEDHLDASDVDLFPVHAVELPVAYLDSDGSEGWTDGDEATYLACNDDGPVSLVWVPGANDLWTALRFSWAELQPGWNGRSVPEAGSEAELLDVATFTDLEIGDGCVYAPE